MKKSFYVLVLAIATFSAWVASSSSRSSSAAEEKEDFKEMLAELRAGGLELNHESRLINKIRAAIQFGDTTYSEIGTDSAEIKLLIAKNDIRVKNHCISQMEKLDPDTELYKTYKTVLTMIVEDERKCARSN